MIRPRIGFIHLPKAAGSAVEAAIGQIAQPWKICSQRLDRVLFGSFDRFDDMSPSARRIVHLGGPRALAGFDIVMGHFSLSTLEGCFDRSDIAMLLREPRARLLSHYQFWRGWEEPMHELFAPYDASRRAAQASFDDFLQDPALASQTDNLALRMLVSPHAAIPADGFIPTSDLEHLAREGMERLSQFGFVDVVEATRMWNRLSRWVGQGLTADRVNVTPNPEPVDGATTDNLRTSDSHALNARTAGDRLLWLHVAQAVAPSPGRDCVHWGDDIWSTRRTARAESGVPATGGS